MPQRWEEPGQFSVRRWREELKEGVNVPQVKCAENLEGTWGLAVDF